MKLKKGSKEAKLFMAKIRAKKKSAKKKTAKKVSIKKPTVKKRVIKKRVIKKRIGSTHKDTASHNVKISVMRGNNNETLEILKMTISKLTYWEKELIRLKAELKLSKDQYQKNGLRHHIKRVKEIISFNKKHITTLKKLIK
jgi:hypothetical protein